MIKAVLFDMDGTLLDTETLYLRSWKCVMEKHGIETDMSLAVQSIGLNYNSMVQLFRDNMGEEFPFELYWSETKDYFVKSKLRDGISVKKGFFELADYLKEKGIKMIIATSTYHDTALTNLKIAGIDAFFDGLIGGDEIENGKPAPDIFLKAAEIAGVSPEECLAVEDSANGVKSVLAAGIKCLYIRDVNDIPENLKLKIHRECRDLSEITEVLESI